MGDLYLWTKIVHILAVISWMAGLFYLPRLFVYHAENGGILTLDKVFVAMEGRLLKAIMRPAAVVSVCAGLLLVWLGSWYGPMAGWLWGKLVLVGALIVFHGTLEFHAGRFRRGVERCNGRYFRVINEVPTVLLIFIVILVVLKPF